MFLRKGVLKIWSKFTGEHQCRSAISIKLQSYFIEIALWHGCSPVNLLHIFRTPFPRNTSGWLLLITMFSNTNNPKFPCRHCVKNAHDKDKAVQCDLCEHWIHIKCNNLNYLDYSYLQTCNEAWYGIECCSKIFPFNSLSCDKNVLACCANTDSSIM